MPEEATEVKLKNLKKSLQGQEEAITVEASKSRDVFIEVTVSSFATVECIFLC